MRIGIVNSNWVPISRYTKKGTEIFDYILIRSLAKISKQHKLNITAFASGDSNLPVPVESVSHKASSLDENVGLEHHKTFEMALVSKAFSMQDDFDLYHVNIGNGDVVLPFAPFVKKPILVTMHGSFLEEKYNKKYLSLFSNLKNIHFISVSDAQRRPFMNLNYVTTIYHGIDAESLWRFDDTGGEYIIWAGRAIREKGMITAIKSVMQAKKKAKMFPILNDQSPRWIRKVFEGEKKLPKNINVRFSVNRHDLVREYQKGKLLLFPIKWEEPFGLIMVEAMACGTPVVAYGRGSVPEVVLDGKTGFIVNPSDEEKAGDFIIKKTGMEGLVEAINRIYEMPEEEYQEMRKNCRQHVEDHFTIKKMAKSYAETYKKVLARVSALFFFIEFPAFFDQIFLGTAFFQMTI